MEISPRIGKEVVRSCKSGDIEAFERIVLCYQKRVFNIAYRMIGNRDEAKDLAQEVFITVHQAIKELKEESKFDAWLTQITLNHCRNRWKFLRRRHYFRSESLETARTSEEGARPLVALDPADRPDMQYEKKQVQEWVQRGLLRLGEEQRELIVLRDLQGLSYGEIGTALGLPEGTVKSKLHRARMELKEILKRMSD